MTNARYGIVAAVMVALVAGSALGASKDELKKRMEARRPKVEALKRQGVVGETWQGTLEVVKSADKDTQKIVNQDNADRADVYALIAKEEGTSEEKVAERAAVKFFEHAAKGEWLKYKDGWKQKG